MIKAALFATLLFALTSAASAQQARPADEELVTKFLATRRALVDEDKVDIAEMSVSIRKAVSEAERFEREANYHAALGKLLELAKYCPLAELPSFDVQMLLSWLYSKLGDPSKASEHRARAGAMGEVLWRRIGRGDAPTDPIQALMINDITEWTRSQRATIGGVRNYPYQGKELQAITYSGPSTGGQPKTAYFHIDPRVQAKANRQIRLYAAIPPASLRPQDLEAIEMAKRKREGFLNDDQFPYLELLGKVRNSIKQAAALSSQGKYVEALGSLKEIEAIRPIEDTPLPDLISTYSFLQGKIGNTEKQIELRRLLFGINQVIAHSGDGLTPETAVHVIATSEEYGWLADSKLSMIRQRVLDTPNGKFDVLSTKDASGSERDYFFNITRIFSKYTQGMKLPASKP